MKKVKDPIAVELGRRGGLKGGKARAKKLTSERLREIASSAANWRWRKCLHERKKWEEMTRYGYKCSCGKILGLKEVQVVYYRESEKLV